MKFTDRLRDGAGCTSHIAAADIIDDLEDALRDLMTINDDHGPFGGEMYRDRVDRAWDRARAALTKLESLSK